MQQHPLIKDYLDIAFRRRWWIILPALAGLGLAVLLFTRFDRLYKASTRVQIRPQTISREILNPIIDINAADLVTPITSEINSEKYVQEVEAELKLVGTPGGPQDLRALGQRLGAAVEVAANARNRYFDLDVVWNDPDTAAAIANTLAQIYIRRSQEIRRAMAGSTVQQLRESRERAEQALNKVRAEMEQFRASHRFDLPGQQQANIEVLRTNRTEMDRLDADIRTFEARIAEIDIRLAAPANAPVVAGPAPDPRSDELMRLRSERDRARAQGMTAQHPRMRSLNEQIVELEKTLGLAHADGEATSASLPVDVNRKQLENERTRLVREIAAARSKQERLRGEVSAAQARLDRSPESQIAYDVLEQKERALTAEYTEARGKEAAAMEGAQVEAYNQGERFEVLNPARPPAEPFWPDLRLFLALGLALGAGGGIGIVLLLEVFDQSFKSEDQLAAAIDLPILAVIPDLERLPAQLVRRARRTRRARTA